MTNHANRRAIVCLRRASRQQPPEANGVSYLKIPVRLI